MVSGSKTYPVKFMCHSFILQSSTVQSTVSFSKRYLKRLYIVSLHTINKWLASLLYTVEKENYFDCCLCGAIVLIYKHNFLKKLNKSHLFKLKYNWYSTVTYACDWRHILKVLFHTHLVYHRSSHPDFNYPDCKLFISTWRT